MSQIDYYTAIYSKLTADQSTGGFYDSVGGRIALAQDVQDDALPLCVFSFIVDGLDRYFALDGIRGEFQTDLYTDALNSTPEDLVAINDKLFALIDKATLTVTDYTNVQVWCLDRGQVTRDENSYRLTARWRIFGTAN